MSRSGLAVAGVLVAVVLVGCSPAPAAEAQLQVLVENQTTAPRTVRTTDLNGQQTLRVVAAMTRGVLLSPSSNLGGRVDLLDDTCKIVDSERYPGSSTLFVIAADGSFTPGPVTPLGASAPTQTALTRSTVCS